MRVVVTGAWGFLGRLVVDELLRRGSLAGARITEVVAADRIAPEGPAPDGVRVVAGELSHTLPAVFADPVDVVIHLAAAVSAECEADLDLGLAANLDLTRALLETARRQHEAGGPLVRLAFSSSVAAYGSDAALPLPERVSEATFPQPQSSYGVQKVACEYLINDYTRRGLIDGRVVRLMTVAIRPGKPNAAASGFVSGIIREPLAGVAARCPVPEDALVAIASPRRTVAGLLAVAEAERGDSPGQLSGRLPVNLPALSVTVAEMLAALRRLAGDEAADLVTFEPDPAIERIVAGWPGRFDNARAHALGIQGDPDIESVIADYLTSLNRVPD